MCTDEKLITLKKQRDEWEQIADEWKKSYDRLKSKYESADTSPISEEKKLDSILDKVIQEFESTFVIDINLTDEFRSIRQAQENDDLWAIRKPLWKL